MCESKFNFQIHVHASITCYLHICAVNESHIHAGNGTDKIEDQYEYKVYPAVGDIQVHGLRLSLFHIRVNTLINELSF